MMQPRAMDDPDPPDVAVREAALGVRLQDPQLDELAQVLDACLPARSAASASS